MLNAQQAAKQTSTKNRIVAGSLSSAESTVPPINLPNAPPYPPSQALKAVSLVANPTCSQAELVTSRLDMLKILQIGNTLSYDFSL